MQSIFDESYEWKGQEIDISAELEEENVKYEREHKSSIQITVINETEHMTPEEKQKFKAEQERLRKENERIAKIADYWAGFRG